MTFSTSSSTRPAALRLAALAWLAGALALPAPAAAQALAQIELTPEQAAGPAPAPRLVPLGERPASDPAAEPPPPRPAPAAPPAEPGQEPARWQPPPGLRKVAPPPEPPPEPPPGPPQAQAGKPPEVQPAPTVKVAPVTSLRLALFPVQNLTGGNAPVKELWALLRERLERRGIPLVPEAEVHRFLAEHRVRYTGGLDKATAAAMRTETGIDAVIIPSLEAWGSVTPYRVALTARMVSTEAEPEVQWTELFARTGNDRPGLLGLGLVPSLERLRDLALEQAVESLASVLQRPRRLAPCPERSATAPRRQFRSPLAADPNRQTVAVLPFLDSSGRRDAGEVVALRFLAALAASDTIQLVEPGVVRAEMLTHRLGAAGALSLDDARVILELVDADLIVSGTVRTFEEAAGGSGAPRVEFGAWVLDRNTRELVWSSQSSAGGDDGVFFFGAGRTSTAEGLACGMAKGAVEQLLRGRPPLTARRPEAGTPARNSGASRASRR